MERTEKTLAKINLPHLDEDQEFKRYLTQYEHDRLLYKVIFFSLLILLINFISW